MTTTDVAHRDGHSDLGARAVPRAVQVSFLSWLGAIGAALLEMAGAVYGAVIDDTMPGSALALNLAVRLAVFAVAVAVMVQMRRGRRWARPVLAVALGGFGTASLVYGPIGWLLAGHSVPALLTSADAAFWYAGAARLLHLAGVAGGVLFMFLPEANRCFARTPRHIR